MDFRQFAVQPDERLDLLTGALLIARDAHPELDFSLQVRRLEELAWPLSRRSAADLPLRAQARMMTDHLYVTCGFRGNVESFQDPRNSFLNDVLDRRKGIPISLAVLYVEVARRAGICARGVGFPGHFLVRLDAGTESLIIDPFSDGRVLSSNDLDELLRRVGGKLKLKQEMLSPTPVRHILARMLINLRGIYSSQANYPQLLLVLDRLIDLVPDVTDEIRDRGFLCARLGAPAAALADLRRYASQFPHAGDVAEVRQLIARLEREPGPLIN